MSVPASIGEGWRRQGAQEYVHFLNTAEGSLAETGCLLVLSRTHGYLEPKAEEGLAAEVEEIGRMLDALRSKVEGRGATSPSAPSGLHDGEDK